PIQAEPTVGPFIVAVPRQLNEPAPVLRLAVLPRLGVRPSCTTPPFRLRNEPCLVPASRKLVGNPTNRVMRRCQKDVVDAIHLRLVKRAGDLANGREEALGIGEAMLLRLAHRPVN